MRKVTDLKKVLGEYEYIKLYKGILKNCKSTKAMLLSAFISKSFKMSNIIKTDEVIWFIYSYEEILNDLQIDLKNMRQTKKDLEDEELINKIKIGHPFDKSAFWTRTFFKINIDNIIKTFDLHKNKDNGPGAVDGSNAFYLINKAIVKAMGIDRALTLINLVDKSEHYTKKHPAYNGWFFSTQQEQADELKVGVQTIRKRIQYLEDLGLLERKYFKNERLNRMVQWTRICYENIFSLIKKHEVDFGPRSTISTFVQNNELFVLEEPLTKKSHQAWVSNTSSEWVSNTPHQWVSNTADIKTEEIKTEENKKSTKVDLGPPKRRAKKDFKKTKADNSSQRSSRTRPITKTKTKTKTKTETKNFPKEGSSTHTSTHTSDCSSESFNECPKGFAKGKSPKPSQEPSQEPKKRKKLKKAKTLQLRGDGASPQPKSGGKGSRGSVARSSAKVAVSGCSAQPTSQPMFQDQQITKLKYENKDNLAIFRYWNEQPNLTRHKKGTKTYKQCLELIQAMRNGTLVDKVKLSEFKGNGVSIDDLYKKWTPKEIRKVIKIINEQHKMGYWPDNKATVPKSLASAIYNPRSGKSWFLMVHKHGLKEIQKPKDRLSTPTKKIFDNLETTLKTLRGQDNISQYENDLIKVSKNIEKYYNNLAHHKFRNNGNGFLFYEKFASSAESLSTRYKDFLLSNESSLQKEFNFKEYKSVKPKGLDVGSNLFNFFIKEWQEYLDISFTKGGPLYEE